MKLKRIIARLDIKNEYLIKGIHLEGLRKIGDPGDFSSKYYAQGIDELIYMDAVASLYERNGLVPIIEKVARDVFIPLTVGGGIRTLEDAKSILRAGADKIAVNTQFIKDPKFITNLAEHFGSQCIVLSVEAKRKVDSWEAYFDNGREHSSRDVIEWCQEASEKGIGEILLTSVDQEGTQKGYDFELLRRVHDVVNVPVLISGGFGKNDDLIKAFNLGADGVVVANHLHYGKTSVEQLKAYAANAGVMVRS